MKIHIAFLTILALAAAGCEREPYANAIISPNPAWVGEDVTFTNISENTEHAEWSMGDGSSSSAFNVVHYYNDPGTYNVTLRAFGKKGDVSVASFMVEVDGSELRIIVKEVIEEYVIEGASILLYTSQNDWYEADVSKAIDEQFTDRYGEAYFSNLSYQKYYVDVYYRVGNEGYVNWLLGNEDIYWVETQLLPGGYDHTFIAYVDFVTFDDQKKSAGRPLVRPPLQELSRSTAKSAGRIPLKENKFSVEKEHK